MKKVLTFGVFDGLHDGHRAMLREAKSLSLPATRNHALGRSASGGQSSSYSSFPKGGGQRLEDFEIPRPAGTPFRKGRMPGLPREYPRNDGQNYLMVAVAPDNAVKKLKAAVPRNSSAKRIAALKKEYIADEVILGDSDLDSWQIVKKVKPDIIALGYDQHELKVSLEKFLEANYPDIETDQGPPEKRAGWQTNPKKPTIIRLRPHYPEKYKSNLIK